MPMTALKIKQAFMQMCASTEIIAGPEIKAITDTAKKLQVLKSIEKTT